MITIEKILFLKRIAIFQSLSSHELRVIAQVTTEEDFAAGEILFTQGQHGDCMYFVINGRVNIFTGEPPKIKVLAVFEPGDFFGEMGLYDNKPRAASAMAIDPARLLVLRKADFCELISDYPEVALGVMKELNQRIRDTNLKLSSYEGQILDKNTRLYSREYFVDCMATEFLKAKKSSTDLSFLTATVRAMKMGEVEEEVVPEVMDQVVADIGRVVNLHQRPNDLSARFAKDRLAVMLTDAKRPGATAFQRRIQKDIEKICTNYHEVQSLRVELNYQIFNFPEDTQERESMIGLLERRG
jgi:diguanylate cyclase (GGDEF)-like protein